MLIPRLWFDVVLWSSRDSVKWEARNMRTVREKRGGGRVLMIENGLG